MQLTEALHQQAKEIRTALDDLRAKTERSYEIKILGVTGSVQSEMRFYGIREGDAHWMARIMQEARSNVAVLLGRALADAETLCSMVDDAIDEAGSGRLPIGA